MRRARTEASEAEIWILDVLFFKTGGDACYLSFADALQADWLIRNAQIIWRGFIIIRDFLISEIVFSINVAFLSMQTKIVDY